MDEIRDKYVAPPKKDSLLLSKTNNHQCQLLYSPLDHKPQCTYHVEAYSKRDNTTCTAKLISSQDPHPVMEHGELTQGRTVGLHGRVIGKC